MKDTDDHRWWALPSEEVADGKSESPADTGQRQLRLPLVDRWSELTWRSQDRIRRVAASALIIFLIAAFGFFTTLTVGKVFFGWNEGTSEGHGLVGVLDAVRERDRSGGR